jgi:cyclophilin family peptidyl-prolyl cis-trans isomerase
MKTPLALLALLAAVLSLRAGDQVSPPAGPAAKLPDGLYAEIVTPRGTITAQLFYEKAPLTVANFVGLAEGALGPKKGPPFFNGLKFHRVVPNFVVQGGDPLGTGEGGPGYSFADEFAPGLHHDAAGVLSMANDGPDTNGSQFFITLREVNRLNYLHSVFGRVVTGLQVLPQISQNDVITAVNIRRIGPAAAGFRADQAAFDRLVTAAKKYTAAPVPGPAANFDDPGKLLPAEPPRALGFQRKLANFERATGVKIYARVIAKFTPETPNQRPGNLAGAMAKQLGLPAGGVLAVYFADIAKWGLWIGDDSLPRFTGRTGTVQELMKDGALHQAKQDFLAAAKTQGDLYTADAIKAAPPDKPITGAQRIKYQVDAVLDALIFKFEPKS